MKNKPTPIAASIFSSVYFAIALLLLSFPLYSQEGEDREEIVNLDPFLIAGDSNVGYRAVSAISSSRVNLPLQDIAQTINVLTSEFLEDTNSFNSREAFKFVTNVNPRTNTHQPSEVFIRGLNVTSQYVDGFLTGGFQRFRDTAFYDRVEVVKGPASAVVGRGEPGGLINYLPKRPFYGNQTRLKFTVGTEDFYRVDLDYNQPLSENLMFRAVSFYQNSDTTRDLQHWERLGFAGHLRYIVSEKTEILVDLEYTDFDAPMNVGSLHYHHPEIWRFWVASGRDQSTIEWRPTAETPFLPPSRILAYPDGVRETEAIEGSVLLLHKFNDMFSVRQGVFLSDGSEDVRWWFNPPFAVANPDIENDFLARVGRRLRKRSYDWVNVQGDLLTKMDTESFLDSTHTVLAGYNYTEGSSTFKQANRSNALGQSFYFPETTPVPPGLDESLPFTTDDSGDSDAFGYYFEYRGTYFGGKIIPMVSWRKDITNSTSNGNVVNDGTETSAPRYAVTIKPVDWLSLFYVHSVQRDPTRNASKYNFPDEVPADDPRQDDRIVTQPEATLNEFGVKWNAGNGKISGAVSYFDIQRTGFLQNSIVIEEFPDVGLIQFGENVALDGEVVKGYEFELYAQPTDRLSIFTSLGIFKEASTRLSADTRAPLRSLPDTLTMLLRYDLTNESGNGFGFTVGGKVWFSGWNLGFGGTAAPVDVQFADNQYELDLGISYAWSDGKYKVQAKVANVTDEFIIFDSNSMFPLRQAWLSFTADF